MSTESGAVLEAEKSERIVSGLKAVNFTVEDGETVRVVGDLEAANIDIPPTGKVIFEGKVKVARITGSGQYEFKNGEPETLRVDKDAVLPEKADLVFSLGETGAKPEPQKSPERAVEGMEGGELIVADGQNLRMIGFAKDCSIKVMNGGNIVFVAGAENAIITLERGGHGNFAQGAHLKNTQVISGNSTFKFVDSKIDSSEAVASAEESVKQEGSPAVVAKEVASVGAEVLGSSAPSGAEMADYAAAFFAANPEVAPAVAAGLAEVKEKAELSGKLSKQVDAAIAAGPSVEKGSGKKEKVGILGRFFGSFRKRSSKEKSTKGVEAPKAASVQAEVATIADSALEAAENVGSSDQAEALKTPVNGALDAKRAEVAASGVEVQEAGRELIKKAQEKLAGLMQGQSLDELERAQAYFEKLDEKGVLDGFELGGKAMNPEEISEHINYLAAATVNTEMDENIEKVFSADESSLRKTGYRELVDVLKPYLAMERLGSKKGLEVKTFFSKLLKAKLKGLDPAKDNTKIALLGHFIRAKGLE